jgi:methylmalonyl-CoA epimerase
MSSFDHVGVLAEDLTPFRQLAERLGMREEPLESHPDRGFDVLWLDLGGVRLEVLCPTASEGRVAEAIAASGPGLHHIAVAVADVDASLAELREAGLPTADNQPRAGLRDTRIAFLASEAGGGVRVELVEHRADRRL